MVKKTVEVGDFAQVSKVVPEKFGMEGSTTVYVAGSTLTPMKGDGYNFRKIFIVAQMEGNHVIVDDDERKGILMDGKYLRLIKGKRADKLKAQLQEDFNKDEENVSD